MTGLLLNPKSSEIDFFLLFFSLFFCMMILVVCTYEPMAFCIPLEKLLFLSAKPVFGRRCLKLPKLRNLEGKKWFPSVVARVSQVPQ